MDVVRARTFDPGGDGSCTFRAAASVHATSDHELLLYCSPRKAETDLLGRPSHTLKLALFAPLRGSPPVLSPRPGVLAERVPHSRLRSGARPGESPVWSQLQD